MFGKIGKGLTKLNPFSDKDKDKSDKKEESKDTKKTDKKDKDNNKKTKDKEKPSRDKSNIMSNYNELAQSVRVTARQSKQTTKAADDFTGFQESTPSLRNRGNSYTDKSILMMAEQKPKRAINVNQTIFSAMQAERDKLPDIEEKRSQNSSSDESSAIVVHTTEDAHDLTNLFMNHRGNNNSDEDDGILKSTFIETK